MRRLRILNFGPIREAVLDIGQVNVIIGQQSSGKSCVLKTACYCAWVEKRIELTQTSRQFDKGTAFMELLTTFYNMAGYVREDTFIEYDSDHLKFSYDHSDKLFVMEWKPGRWDYHRTKVCYIPADRNLVAAIPSWSSVPLDENLLEFMANWDRARRYIGEEVDVLGLGMSYRYDAKANTDSIILSNKQPLTLKESSSGVQSLIPMFVHLDYMTGGLYDDSIKLTYEQKEERNALLEMLREMGEQNQAGNLFERFTKTNHCEIFLEEPENNLFPPTQCQFIDWLIDAAARHGDMLFVATHSPYVLNQFIKDNPDGLTVFFTYRSESDEQLYSVRQLNEEEIQEVYDNGVDMFFNFEAYI